jgi:tyrosine-protein phosphatase YwqE
MFSYDICTMLDFHNHILPGIDDGSPDIETSNELLKGLMDLGFECVKPSPHIIADTHPNTSETIKHAFDLLESSPSLDQEQKSQLKGFSAEHMMDDIFLQKLESKEPLLCIKDKHLLVEFSYAHKPDKIENFSFAIQIQGYIPILAHPERYGYFYKEFAKNYSYLKDLGFDFQLNLLSLTPYYGKDVQTISHKLLNEGFYDYACTDLHHFRHLEALKAHFTPQSLKELFQKYQLKNDDLI